MEITFFEAEFLAAMLDKSVELYTKMEIPDIVAVAAFCGQNIPDKEDSEIRDALQFQISKMYEIRKKINDCYGI